MATPKGDELSDDEHSNDVTDEIHEWDEHVQSVANAALSPAQRKRYHNSHWANDKVIFIQVFIGHPAHGHWTLLLALDRTVKEHGIALFFDSLSEFGP